MASTWKDWCCIVASVLSSFSVLLSNQASRDCAPLTRAALALGHAATMHGAFFSSMLVFETAQVRDTDLDALERVVSIVAFGDVDAEGPPGAIADVSLRRLLRLSQLANEYLLHVQDHLATRHHTTKVAI